VKKATDVPTQISIEDTYQGLTEMDEIRSELRKLTGHLLERMRLDLLDEERWLARPRTLRLSTRPKTLPAEDKPYNYARKSKSQPLPSFVLNAKASIDELVDRLLDPLLLPMFFQMTPEKRSRRVGMLNVCVTNMVPTGTEDGSGLGRNISSMLRGQDEALRQWTVYDAEPPNTAAARPDVDVREGEDKEVGAAAEEDWIDERENALIDRPPTDDDALERCHLCGHFFPGFAAAAHARYHSIENG
jgi:DNA polymerase iota